MTRETAKLMMSTITPRTTLLFIVLLIVMLSQPLSAFAAKSLLDGVTPEQIQTLGEQMYRRGVLPSGEPIKAYVSGDVEVDGTSFTCISCHLRSGLGSVEGEVITPPTNGRILYKERKPYIVGAEFVPLYHNYAVYLPERPAYTDETLAKLIASGIDPNGRSVLAAMPRYDIDDRDMAILIEYLKTLSDQFSPGVTKDHMNFATVIVEGADPRSIASMLLPIQFSVERKNSLAVASKNNDRVARMAYNMLGDLHAMTFSLDQWVLKGAPETWRAQLEDYYAKNPVFALLGGISPGEWGPVHRFCEDHKLPDLFPIVDYPVISQNDWYTQYLARGFRQEGEAAARYLNSLSELLKGKKVIQVVRASSRGRALAEGFRSIWMGRGHVLLDDIVVAPDETFSGLQLQHLIADQKPDVLLYWDDSRGLDSLAALDGLTQAPGIVISSASWMGPGVQKASADLRKQLYLTYPYRLPVDETRYDVDAHKVLAGKSAKDYDPVILRKSFITQDILGKALMEMRGEYYRDFLFDTIGMFDDMYLPLYERLSFGPGQRYASKGCYIVKLGKGDPAPLEAVTEWVIQ